MGDGPLNDSTETKQLAPDDDYNPVKKVPSFIGVPKRPSTQEGRYKFNGPNVSQISSMTGQTTLASTMLLNNSQSVQ